MHIANYCLQVLTPIERGIILNYNNLTMLTDLYEITMMQGYHYVKEVSKTAVFDLFYRKNPSGSGYAICAGLDQVIDYIKSLSFSDSDIEYLRSQNLFNDEFLKYLKSFKFTGDIYAIPEGTVVFPTEPLLRIKAPIMEAQLIESALLNIINHQCLIATKASRIVWASNGDSILEFGLRRAQGPDAGIYGARAAIIGGCSATSNVLAGKMFDIPVRGTHAHSWIMSFNDEITAFREYAKVYPQSCIFLVDTYDTLRSGVPNAIKVFNEMKSSGFELKNYGIRLDSGDLAYLSKEARKMLDDSGFDDAIISASSDLDEYLIRDLKLQGAKITLWGVGTNLITSEDCPAFGGVYKLAAESDKHGVLMPKIKLSENVEKVTNPSIKKVVRFYDKKSGKIKADLIALDDENFDSDLDLNIFDPISTWKNMTLKKGTYTVRELLIPVFLKGECVYASPSVMQIRDYCQRELLSLWDEHKRLVNPQLLPVDLSKKLWGLKHDMIKQIKG